MTPALATLFLAQSEGPPPELLAWLSAAAWLVVFIGGLLGIAVAVKTLREKKEGLPSPLVVKADEEFATVAAVKELDRLAHGRMSRERNEVNRAIATMEADKRASELRLDAELESIRKQIGDNHEAGESRANKIHDRINALVNDNATMPTRVVELLRTTKGLLG